MPKFFLIRALLVAGSLVLGASLPAQISIQGITDKTVYVDQASFTVPTVAGWTYTVELDGVAVPAGAATSVTSPDYHEVFVRRQNNTTSAVETRTFQFIVRASERANSEWGLPTWVPYPVIPSADAEFLGASLKLIAPAQFPPGIEIPVVAWVVDAAGERVGANGWLQDAAFPRHAFLLRRGVGSGYLPAQSSGGNVVYTPQVGGIAGAKSIAIDATTSWTTVSGAISSSTTWAENARVQVTGDVTVAAGVTLTIGAGSVVSLAAGAAMDVNGTLRINGTSERPVVFVPTNSQAPWGGLTFKTAASVGEIAGTIFIGSGADPDWFDNTPNSGSSHRDEEPCIYLSGGARVTVTDSALIDGAGQAGHLEGSFLTFTRTLIQRFITSGQYNGGTLRVESSAVIEFPLDGAPFADADNDAIYMTGGAHFITNSLIGWAGDDGMDAGSGSAGPVTVTGCWIESCFHEGMAWSEDRQPTVRDTVSINNGQGIECGFGSPEVDAARILSTGNLSGARFGDNYDWDYDGTLKVTDSLLLHNYRDIFSRAWDNWTEHLSQMDVRQNYTTTAYTSHPNNTLWDPGRDAARLTPFLPTPATAVGIGIALRAGEQDMAELARGIPVRLSTFTTHEVRVNLRLATEAGPIAGGTLVFTAGETVQRFKPAADLSSVDFLYVRLESPVGGQITGIDEASYIRFVPVTLIAKGATWKYEDSGVSLGSAWRELDYNDTGWKSGPAQLGFGDNGEVTTVNGGPDGSRFPTLYFRRAIVLDDPTAIDSLIVRLRRDDGGVVYLNGVEVFRTNMPGGTIAFGTLASSSSTSESRYFETTIGPDDLRAGKNVIAVEVHQADVDSSDLSMDLELVGIQRPSTTPTRFVRGDANLDGDIDISDPLRILFFLFSGTEVTCLDALDADDGGSVSLTDAIFELRFLFQGGPAMPPPFPDQGIDPSDDTLSCSP